MSVMAIISAVLTVLGGIVSIVTTGLVSGINTQKKKIEDLEAANKELQARVDASESKIKLSVDEAVKTREEVIANLKKEIQEMEAQLASNPDPAAVRSRLSKLLAG